MKIFWGEDTEILFIFNGSKNDLDFRCIPIMSANDKIIWTQCEGFCHIHSPKRTVSHSPVTKSCVYACVSPAVLRARHWNIPPSPG